MQERRERLLQELRTAEQARDFLRACYELGRKPHRNGDCTVGLVPWRFPFPLFLSLS